MTLNIDDRNYISEQLNDSRKLFTRDMERYFGIIKEDFNHKLDIVIEISKSKPHREEVREIARDEAKYALRNEIGKIGKLKLATS